MKFLTNLLEYQKQAVNKLSRVKVGALYMEMGTGKTRTALELAYRRIEKGKADHIIWLCPCSVKEGLKDEFEKHIGTRVPAEITICGIQTLSTSVKYNSMLLDMVEKQRCFLIVDESNMVKNSRAKRTENITRIAEKCTYKLILNGTPITRNEADLFAQWYLLDWRILGYKSYYSFAANHLEFDECTNRIRHVLNVDYLVQKMAPYSYQVKKSECLDLPEKTYKTKYFNLSDDQYDHYSEVADILLDELFNREELEKKLRKEKNTSYTLSEAPIYRLFSALQAIISGHQVTLGKHLERSLFFKNVEDNPRIQLLEDIISDIYGNKTIIFCEYSNEVRAITELLNKKYGKGSATTFYGEDSLKHRNEHIEQFKNNAMFLVTNKDCSAYGLNLQFCSYAIYYSNDWDFGTRQQSEDRLHRLGQTDNVHIVDICAENTIDEKILSCLRKKERLVDCFKDELSSKSKEDAKKWLKSI